MPKLLGYRERIPMNVYDAFSILPGTDPLRPPNFDRVPGGRVRLFGNANIGSALHTNLQIGGMFSRDQTAIVMNWYARSNMTSNDPDFLRAWHAWTHATTVTLFVGDSPLRVLPLADLLGRHEGQMKDVFQTNGATADEHLNEHLARALYEHRYGVGTWTAGITDDIKDAWRATAGEAHRVLRPCVLAIIPVRQNYGVSIDTADVRALRAVQELMPKDIAPQALVWVHLEGVMSRDVA